MNEILEILEKNCKLSDEQIATMLNISKEDVRAEIEKLEKQEIIIGYQALINWEKTKAEKVSAIVDVKVTPQKNSGFDDVAKKICVYPEVVGCYLTSGNSDLTVIVEAKTMKEVANFVSEKLATIDTVQSTATHFIMKKYKDKGKTMELKKRDDREVVVL